MSVPSSDGKKTCPACGQSVDAHATVCPRDGTPLTLAIQFDPLFSKYEFQGVIGSGGMGVIVKARHQILNKFVAIKTLHAHLITPGAMRRFQIEGKATSSLDHPSIVAIHDFGITDSGQAFMVMEYIDGCTLSEILQRDAQLSMGRFFEIFDQVCEALEHAHSHSVLHRDLKPGNIMVKILPDGKEEVRLMDFGIAKILADTDGGGSHLTGTGETIGSPAYMSPEQAEGSPVDLRSDLYSLGCVMYEALTGTPPFDGPSPLKIMLMHREEIPLPLTQASMGRKIDPSLSRVVMQLLEKNPSDRFQSVSELKIALKDLRNPSKRIGKTTTSKLAGIKSGAVNRDRNLIVIASAISSVLILALAVSIYMMQVDQEKLPAEKLVPADIAALNESPLASVSISDAIAAQLKSQREKIDIKSLDGFDKLTTDDLKAFQNATPATKMVDMQSSPVEDEGLENLKGMKLTELNLGHTKVRDLHALLAMSSLSTLGLPGSQLSPDGYQNLTKLKSLRTVDFEKTENFNAAAVGSMKNLTSLKLNFVPLSKADLIALGRLKNLEYLSIVGTTVESLLPLAGLINLKELNCSGCTLDRQSFKVIGSFKHLRTLQLASTPLDDAELSEFRQLNNLERLVINWTNVSVNAADQFSNDFPILYLVYDPKNPLGGFSNISALASAAEKARSESSWKAAATYYADLACSSKDGAQRTRFLVAHADCLTAMGLFCVAVKLYDEAIIRLFNVDNLDDLPLIYAKKAIAFEHIGSIEYLKIAIRSRLSATVFFELRLARGNTFDGIEGWKALLARNREFLRKDIDAAVRLNLSKDDLASLVPVANESDTAGSEHLMSEKQKTDYDEMLKTAYRK